MRPTTALDATARARSLVGKGGVYALGTGDFLGDDKPPWTERGGLLGSDCAGFAISWCYKLVRHRPGFNAGYWASVSDDLNCNSAIEDADHKRELFERVTVPALGDLLVYPTFHLPGHPQPWIGHVAIVTSMAGAMWDGRYASLGVAQCCGPDGRGPAVVATSGSHWDDHDRTWPKPEHRSVILRAIP